MFSNYMKYQCSECDSNDIINTSGVFVCCMCGYEIDVEYIKDNSFKTHFVERVQYDYVEDRLMATCEKYIGYITGFRYVKIPNNIMIEIKKCYEYPTITDIVEFLKRKKYLKYMIHIQQIYNMIHDIKPVRINHHIYKNTYLDIKEFTELYKSRYKDNLPTLSRLIFCLLRKNGYNPGHILEYRNINDSRKKRCMELFKELNWHKIEHI